MGQPIVHFEIIGRDAPKLKEFYTKLFDWKIGELHPDMGNYGVIDGDSSGIGGGIGETSDANTRVTVYAQVPNLRTTLDEAVALGGTVVMEPTDIPGVVTLAMFADPDGNIVGGLARDFTDLIDPLHVARSGAGRS